MGHQVRIQRVREYVDRPDASDGTVVLLVDRVWPRGIAKAKLDVPWHKEVAPSTGLRKWFGHEPERFAEFRRRYREELDANPATEALLDAAGNGPVLLLYDAKDTEHNQAVVLADWLRDKRGGSHR
jgi:uncharacterized protein YeaO (DUF488 family)